jgi:hypothetical protein
MIFGWLNNTRQHLSEEQLSAYVDGAPDAPSEDRVQQHLATCDATCSADLEGLRATVDVLNSIAPVDAPRSFALTAAMVADLPDGKPLGEPPAPARTGGWRMPVLVPAAASIAAAVVFALVLVGNLSGVIEQSGNSSNDAMSIATGTGGGLEVAVEAEMIVTPEMAAAAAPIADSAAVAEARGLPGERISADAAAPVAAQAAAQPESAFAPPSAAPAPEAAVSEALPLAPKAAPDVANLEMAPELESPEDAAADGSEVLELPQVELFDTGAASTATALEGLPVEAIAQDEAQVLQGDVAYDDLFDDDFTLPVWQLLLATGIITALLAGVSFQLSRRNIPG